MTEDVVTLPADVPMPLLGLGTWQLRGRSAYRAALWALEVGYRHFDTATMYRNEAELGRALRDSGLARDQVFITTKLPPNEAGNEQHTIERSLKALGTDYVDLWLVHWPPRQDGLATWRAFADVAQQGLARAIGVSNYTPQQIDELIEASGVIPAVNQISWSPFIFDRARLEHSRDRGVVLEGYSPFKTSRLNHPLLSELGARHNRTPAQIILRWHLEHEVPVIPKSASKERIAANFDVFNFSLEDHEIEALDDLSNHT
jgi:2,5-diketo-D-gluconate reductase A